MGDNQQDSGTSRRELFDAVLSGEQQRRPFIPRLRSDPSPFHPSVKSLDDFRREEGNEREKRLHILWKKIPHPRPPRGKHAGSNGHGNGNGNGNGSGDNSQEARLDAAKPRWEPAGSTTGNITRERAEHLTRMYHDELIKECALEDGTDPTAPVTWLDFKAYANYKEAGMCQL